MEPEPDAAPDTFICAGLLPRGQDARAFCTLVNSYVRERTSSHVWQSEPLRFEEQPHAITATQHYGDAVDDEWLGTHLVREVSLLPEAADAVFSLTDTDGQFLATEAADALPSWLDPACSENRIFLFRGDVHIIPSLRDTHAPPAARLEAVPSLEAGAAWVRAHAASTRASDAVQSAIARRLAEAPGRAAASLHVARLYVPPLAAHVLRAAPHLAAQATAAFYSRDPVEASAASRLRVFSPVLAPRRLSPEAASGDPSSGLTAAALVAPAPPALVAVSVRLTRCLYAQLGQQRFHPPRPFMTALPPGVTSASGGGLPPAYSLGARLAIGLEVLLLRGGQKGSGSGRHDAFLSRLKAFGWPGLGASSSAETYSGASAADVLATIAAMDGATLPGGAVLAALLCDPAFLAACPDTALPAADRDDSTAWLFDEAAAEAELAAHARMASASGSSGSGRDGADSGEVVVKEAPASDDESSSGLSAVLAGLGAFMGRSSGIDGVGVASAVGSGTPGGLDSLREEDGDEEEEGDGESSDDEGDTDGEEDDDDEDEEDHEGGTEAESRIAESGGAADVPGGPPCSSSVGTATTTAVVVDLTPSPEGPSLPLAMKTDRATLVALLALHTAYAEAEASGCGGAAAAGLDARLADVLRGGSNTSKAPAPPRKERQHQQQVQEQQPSLLDVMAAMDEQLYGPSATEERGGEDEGRGDAQGEAAAPAALARPLLNSQTFERMPVAGAGVPSPGGSEQQHPLVPGPRPESGPFSDADIGHNLLRGLGASVAGQLGEAGPASNLLGYLGVGVPQAWWKGGEAASAAAEPAHHAAGRASATSLEATPAGSSSVASAGFTSDASSPGATSFDSRASALQPELTDAEILRRLAQLD